MAQDLLGQEEDNLEKDYYQRYEEERFNKAKDILQRRSEEEFDPEVGGFDWNKVSEDFNAGRIIPETVSEYDGAANGIVEEAEAKVRAEEDPDKTGGEGYLYSAGMGVVKSGASILRNSLEILKPDDSVYQTLLKNPAYKKAIAERDAARGEDYVAPPTVKTIVSDWQRGIKDWETNTLYQPQTTGEEITETLSQVFFSLWALRGKGKSANIGQEAGRAAVAEGMGSSDIGLLVGVLEDVDKDTQNVFLDLVRNGETGEINQTAKMILTGVEAALGSAVIDSALKGIKLLRKGKGGEKAADDLASKLGLGDEALEETGEATARQATEEVVTESGEQVVKAETKQGDMFTNLEALVTKEAKEMEAAEQLVKDGKLDTALKGTPIGRAIQASKDLESTLKEIESTADAFAPKLVDDVAEARKLADDPSLITTPKHVFQAASVLPKATQKTPKQVQTLTEAVRKTEAGELLSKAEQKAMVDELKETTRAINETVGKLDSAVLNGFADESTLGKAAMVGLAEKAGIKGVSLNAIQAVAEAMKVTGKEAAAGGLAGLVAAPVVTIADDNGDPVDMTGSTLAWIAMGALAGIGGMKAVGAFKNSRMAKGAIKKEADLAAEELVKKQEIYDKATFMARNLPDSYKPKGMKKEGADWEGLNPKATPEQLNALVKALAGGDEKAVADAGEGLINWNNIDTAADVDNIMTQVMESIRPQVQKTLDKTQPLKHIEEFYRDMDMSPKAIVSLAESTKDLGLKIQAARAMIPTVAAHISTLIVKRGEIPRSDSIAFDMATLNIRKQTTILQEVMFNVRGISREVGRGLSAHRITARSNRMVEKELETLIEDMGGREVNNTFVKAFEDMYKNGGANGVAKWATHSALDKTVNAVKASWYSGVLSGIETHVVNMMSGVIRLVEGQSENFIANSIGKMRGSKGAEFYKTQDMAMGMMIGLKVAAGVGDRTLGTTTNLAGGNILTAFRNNHSVTDAFGKNSYIERSLKGQQERPFGVSAENFNVGQKTALGQGLNAAGKLLKLPSQALIAEDEMFKSINYMGKLYELAAQEARSTGKVGDDFMEHVADRMKNPTDEFKEQGIAFAREGTFTTELEGWQRGMHQMLQSDKIPLGMFIMPFVRTPVNLVNHFAERFPLLGLLAKKNRKILKEGTPREKDLLMAKQAMGATYLGSGAMLYSEGLITGSGLGDPNKSAQDTAGRQASSIKIGDKWYSYNRVDPVGYFLTILTDGMELMNNPDVSEEDKASIGLTSVAVLGNFLTSKTYLRNIGDLVKLLNSTKDSSSNSAKRNLDRYLGNMASGFVPFGSLQKGISKNVVDPHIKDSVAFMDYVKSRVIGGTLGQENRVDIFGEDKEYEGAGIANIANPIYVKTEKEDKTSQEILRLDIDLSPYDRQLGNVKLTSKEYHDLSANIKDFKLNGNTWKQALEQLVESPRYEQMSEEQGVYDGSKEKAVRSMYNYYKNASKNDYLRKNKGLGKQVMEDLRNKSKALQGQQVSFETPNEGFDVYGDRSDEGNFIRMLNQ
jgi:hypothetical protein